MRALPSGTVTFLFTDIEGSTKLLRSLGDGYAGVLSKHREIIRASSGAHGGVEVDTQGDAFFVAFASAPEAVAAATDAQRTLAAGPVRVRMGIHTGQPLLTNEGYVGLDVHKGARVAAAAHGGQVVVTNATHELIDDGDAFLDLGEHRLKDFDEPIRLFQCGDGLFPPLRTISNTNLPRPASSFIGRAREVSDIVALIRDGARLVTLSGPGGSGKTRAGIEAATELIGDFKAGAYWVPLSSVREPHLVLDTVAQTIGGSDDPALLIGEREMLLLIDNFEQVVDAAPRLADLLERCPTLSIIVTSRELLRVRGEVEYPVPPLVESEAVQLFCARAQMDASDAVAELCARLDDLPLAIELAAARARVLSPEQIIERLSDRLDLLKGGRDADPRQKTLRATIEWSYALLPNTEKRLFADLAVFSGGCDLEGAHAVCGADIDSLQGLVEKSLVRRTGERFWMLETVRELAIELLHASGRADELRAHHYDHFLERARRANISGDSESDQHMELIIPDRDNYRAAFEYAKSRGDVAAALDVAIAVELWWAALNPSEGLQRVEPLLSSSVPIDEELRAKALRLVGGARQISGKHDESLEATEESLAIFRKLGDALGAARLLERLAVNASRRQDFEAARAYLDESIELAGGQTTGRLGALHLRSLAMVEYFTGDKDRALELLRECARLAGEIGFKWWEMGALLDLAELALRIERTDEADPAAREGLELAREIDDGQGTIYGLGALAWVASARGEARRAGALWGAIEAFEISGSPTGGWPEDREMYTTAAVRENDPAFSEGRKEGRRLSTDGAVEFALAT